MYHLVIKVFESYIEQGENFENLITGVVVIDGKLYD